MKGRSKNKTAGMLWDPIPQAEDGGTSQEAPEPRVSPALTLVKNRPGSTVGELWQAQAWHPGAMSRGEILRRLADIERRGFVRQGDARLCRVDGVTASTWWLTGSSQEGG